MLYPPNYHEKWVITNPPYLAKNKAKDKTLFNQYSVIPVNKAKCPNVKSELAQSFSDWLIKPETQKFIGDFKLLDKTLFTPNASK